MARELCVIPVPIVFTNVGKYVLEALFCSIIFTLAHRTQYLVHEKRLPNRFPTSRNLWTTGWRFSGRNFSKAFIILSVLLHCAFISLEFAFDATEIPEVKNLITEFPEGPFRFGDQPLHFRFHEATVWCSQQGEKAELHFFKPRMIVENFKFNYSQVRMFGRRAFTCPGNEMSSVQIDEKPFTVIIWYISQEARGLENKTTIKPAISRYFPLMNFTLVVGGIDPRITRMAFDSLEDEVVYKDRDNYILFLRYHISKYIWSGTQRKKERVIVNIREGTSVSFAVFSVVVHITLVSLTLVLNCRASPEAIRERTPKLPTHIDSSCLETSSSNSDTPNQHKHVLSLFRSANEKLQKEGDYPEPQFHTWNVGP